MKKTRALAISSVIQLRSEETRTLADMMDTKITRRELLAIAERYDRLFHALVRERETQK